MGNEAALSASNIRRTATSSNIVQYETPEVTKEDDFMFDLTGYLLLPQALRPEEVADLNEAIDAIPPLEPREWFGHVHRNDYAESWGYNLQNIVEGGAPFEALIDCPAFLPWVQRYAGHDGLFIDEALVTVRRPGQGVSLHSGGHKRRVRTQYRVATGGADGVSDLEWRVGQLNVMVALTDCKEGDGGTMLVPGSVRPREAPCALAGGRSLTRVACGLAAQVQPAQPGIHAGGQGGTGRRQ